MTTKDWSRMVGSDTSPRVPKKFVRYDKNGTVPGSSYVITATTQTIVNTVAVPELSATDLANITNAIKEGKSVSIYDATAGSYFVLMIAERLWSKTMSSFVIVMSNPFAIVKYLRDEDDMVSIRVYVLNMPTM